MLPIYQAKSFVEVVEKGGRTKPWVVIVDAKGTPKKFVVKVFGTDLIETRNSVCNEVLGSVLAKEFDLSTPTPALIDFDSNFKNTLNAIPTEILETKDDRIKFGSELISNTIPYDQSLSKQALDRYLDYGTLFAFDSLIRNRDRNNDKPNLFFSDGKTYLIDHEMAFEKLKTGLRETKENNLNPSWMKYHLCQKKLSLSKDKDNDFETFREYFRSLNVNVIDGYIKQLRKEGHPCREAKEIKEWLNYNKANSAIFIQYLKHSIS